MECADAMWQTDMTCGPYLHVHDLSAVPVVRQV